jgi:hypothetical protein
LAYSSLLLFFSYHFLTQRTFDSCDAATISIFYRQLEAAIATTRPRFVALSNQLPGTAPAACLAQYQEVFKSMLGRFWSSIPAPWKSTAISS